MSLQIPSFLYGFYRDVRPACRRKLKALERGASFPDIVDSWLDVGSTPGVLMLEGPNLHPTELHFQCFALTYTLVETWARNPSAELDALLDQWGTELELRADWKTLMFCLIHHAHDFDRALAIWDAHVVDVPEIQWAAEQLADGIAEGRPKRACELYVFAAEAPLAIGKRHIYRTSAALVAKACRLLRAAGLERDALDLVSNFRSRHARRRVLLDAIIEQGL